ncbi:TetR/AcrR family transcriptional regulator [Microtetraspora glauca]|uniref:TetR/AcrR family transcriptional regulator n=1 Tax=Microtetraspora glauca TaxID=1996 RepID=A0ABV3GU36_MICGL
MVSRPTVQARARARRRDVRGDILNSARSLLAEVPFADLSIDMVMAAAGRSRTIFYRHFDDRQQLLLALLEELGGEMTALGQDWAQESAGQVIPRLREDLGGLVDIWVRNGSLMRALAAAAAQDPEVDAMYHALADRFIAITGERIKADIASGASTVANGTETARALVWMTERYLSECFGRGPASVPPETAKKTLGDIWVRAIYSISPDC